MIEWVREKFSKIVSVLFVITVIISTIAGALIGYSLFDGTGCIIGIVIGFLLGIILGIFTFGFIATIINISVTCDKINSKLESIDKKISNSNGLLEKSTFSVRNPKEVQNNLINKKIEKVDSESTLSEDSNLISNESNSQKKFNYINNINKDDYTIIEKDGKKFAIKKNESADIYFCPNCYVQVSPSLDTCFRCLKRFDSIESISILESFDK